MPGCITITGIDSGDERPPLINIQDFNDFHPYWDWDNNSISDENRDTNGPNVRIIGDYHEST